MAAVAAADKYHVNRTFDVINAYSKNPSPPRAQDKSRRRSVSTHKSPRRATNSARSKSATNSSHKRHSLRRRRPNSPSGALSLLHHLQALQAMMPGLKERNKAALAGLFPNENSTTVGNKIKEFSVKSHPEFAVGI